MGLPWIDDRDLQIVEVPRIAGGEHRFAGQRDAGDEGVAHVDRAPGSLPAGCESRRLAGGRFVEGARTRPSRSSRISRKKRA